jgi:NAD(P)H-nitrite reductase large subunit
MQSGVRLQYDRLGIATGASAVRPAVPGIRAQGVFDLYTLTVAESTKAWLSGTRRVVILGAGLIGMKAAAALTHLGKQVILVEQKRTVMPDTLDLRAAALMAARFSELGVQVRTDETVCEVVTNGEGRIRSVRLASGESIECDMLLCAVGTRPNSGLIRQAGGKANPGVAVNQFLETSLPHVYAAGDVAQAPMIHSERVLPAANWYNAKREGRIAAYNMLGMRTEYAGRLRANAVELLGVPLVSVGEVHAGAGEELTFEDPTGPVYRRLLLRDGRLVGVILVGQIDEAGALTYLLQTARPISQVRDRLINGVAACLPALSIKTWNTSGLTLDAGKATA